MELRYDWKGFQTLFYTRRKLTTPEILRPIYLVTERKTVISAFCEGEDLSDWLGAPVDDMSAEFSNRELVFYDREKVDEWMNSSIGLQHFYDQIQYLRVEAKPQLVTRSRLKHHEHLFQNHFLLAAVQSWWHKILPSSFGIYIRLDGPPHPTSLFLVVQRGRVGSFHVPDLSSMIPDRRKHSNDVVKFLSEHYMMPVQGMFLTSEEWVEWSESDNPWRKILTTLKTNRGKLAPFSWGLTTLIASRAYFGL